MTRRTGKGIQGLGWRGGSVRPRGCRDVGDRTTFHHHGQQDSPRVLPPAPAAVKAPVRVCRCSAPTPPLDAAQPPCPPHPACGRATFTPHTSLPCLARPQRPPTHPSRPGPPSTSTYNTSAARPKSLKTPLVHTSAAQIQNGHYTHRHQRGSRVLCDPRTSRCHPFPPLPTPQCVFMSLGTPAPHPHPPPPPPPPRLHSRRSR